MSPPPGKCRSVGTWYVGRGGTYRIRIGSRASLAGSGILILVWFLATVVALTQVARRPVRRSGSAALA